MVDNRKQLDESLSIDALQKSLTGKANVRPALDRIEISPSGQVQPKSLSTEAPASATRGSGESLRSDE